MVGPRTDVKSSGVAGSAPDMNRWAERRGLARLLKVLVLLAPIVVSVGFVALASRMVARPDRWFGVVGWWLGLTLVSTVVLAATERLTRKVLPLVALFNLSLIFPDHAPSRFKVAMRTNTLRQLQRSLEAGELDQTDFQEAAERLVALAGALNAHDRMTRGHTERVRAYTLMIGEELHLPKPDLDRLHWAGLVHDIGKLEVPPSILNKPGRPDDDEWRILQQHPAAAVRLLEPLRPWLGEWADAASQHHERWDGKGYPFGLAGEQISLSGRIVAVADAFDVMTSVRSYKKAMTPEAARAELLRCAGTQFDADVVRAFLNISVGKLRLVMGPLSWLAQVPALGNVPIGTAAATAASSLVSVGIAVSAGLTGGNDPTPSPAPTPVVAFAQAPVARPLMIRELEDQPVTLPGTTSDDDPPTSLSVTSVPDHFRVDRTSPLVLIPDDNWFGRTTGEYEACWNDSCSTALIDIDVQSVNDVPIAMPDGATTPEETAVTIDALTNDTDIEDDHPQITDVTVDSPGGAGTATLTPDNNVSFRPTAGFVGTVQLSYEIADSDFAAATGTIKIEVTALDDPPAARDDFLTIQAGMTDTIDVLANDADSENEPLTIVSVTPPSVGVVVLTANSVSFHAPAESDNRTTFTYTIEDSNGGRGQATVYITIAGDNRPAPAPAPPPATPPTPTPTARSDQATMIEDDPPITIDFLANDTSADGDLTDDMITITGAPGAGTASIVGQQLRYQPNPDTTGVDTITYQLCETTGTCNAAIVTVTITPRNDPPLFNDAGPISVTEDSGPATTNGWASGVTPGPSNESAQNISFTVTVDQPALFAALPAIGTNGALTFTPAADAHGTATISVTAVDNDGTSNGGNDRSTPHSATITITAVNDPVIATDDAATISEDDPAGTTIGVLANDTDADNDALTVSSIDTTSITGGTVTNLGNGLINYTPDPDFNGTETLAYTVTDGNGSTGTATVTITITPTPDAPVATADSFASSEDTPRIVTAPGLIANDYDEDGDSVTITPTPITGPSNGTLTLGTDGAFTYTPTTGFVGTDTFTYQLNDATGLTDTGTVTITVDSGLTTGGFYLGDTPSFATWNMTVAPPANATPEPDRDADGNPGITVPKDGIFGTKTWIRNISGDALALNGPVTLELWSTIEDFDTNKDGHPDITLYDCNTLGLGCVTLDRTEVHIKNYNGGIANWVRVDISLGNITHTFPIGRQLRLQIKHGHHDLWIATSGTRPSRLTYTLANTSPNATNDTTPAIFEDSGTTNIDVLANDTDTNLDPGSVTITSAPTKGTATPLPDGTINYQTTPNLNGADSFIYRVCDTGGLCATASVTINITAVNDQPTFSAGADITINATDPPYTQSGWAVGITPGPANETSQTLTFTITADDPTLFNTQPALSPTGTITFTPSGIPGTTTITIQLIDNGGTANGGNNTAPPQTAQITFA